MPENDAVEFSSQKGDNEVSVNIWPCSESSDLKSSAPDPVEDTRITLFIKPVSVNAMYRTHNRSIVLSVEGREFKKTMIELLAQTKHGFIRGPIKLNLAFEFTTYRKRDLDNYAKPLIDSLKNVLFEDDSEIYFLNMSKRIGAAADCVRIECEPVYDNI